MILKDKLAAQIPAWRERVAKLVQEHGDALVGQVTVRQVYGGMRGVKSLVSDISYVDPNEGIRLRGDRTCSIQPSRLIGSSPSLRPASGAPNTPSPA